ncbi:MAG TPA: hypothetical protein VGQ11_11505 [Candidatus Acidoferrales bacterium]|nr:hypothetical protein [Candidatus Acidoferrales bacterium]
MNLLLMAFYVGPDQMMPVASILATVMGFVMIFWSKVLGVFRRIFGGSKPPEAESSAPQNPKDQPK